MIPIYEEMRKEKTRVARMSKYHRDVESQMPPASFKDKRMVPLPDWLLLPRTYTRAER